MIIVRGRKAGRDAGATSNAIARWFVRVGHASSRSELYGGGRGSGGGNSGVRGSLSACRAWDGLWSAGGGFPAVMQSQSLREVALALGLGTSGAARRTVTAVADSIASDLARHFGFVHGKRVAARFDGERPGRVHEGFRIKIARK